MFIARNLPKKIKGQRNKWSLKLLISNFVGTILLSLIILWMTLNNDYMPHYIKILMFMSTHIIFPIVFIWVISSIFMSLKNMLPPYASALCTHNLIQWNKIIHKQNKSFQNQETVKIFLRYSQSILFLMIYSIY